MNKSDSEKIAAVLENKGYKPAENEREADLIALNMCSVRQTAVDRVYGKLNNFTKLKKIKKLKIILAGCILNSDRKKLKEKGVDEIWENKKFWENEPKYLNEKQACIPISNGCNNDCTYCAVPLTRGKLVCRSYDKIIKDAKQAAEKGFKEIWLLGQNVNDYKYKNFNFAKLIKIVDNIPGDFKFFFVSPHPKDFSEELIKTLAKCQKFGKFLNLPLQSGDNEILKKMARPYTAEHYKKLVKKIRKEIPGINLSTDVIVGFPGETKKQFNNTFKMFKEINFDMAYISKFSPRPGTLASKMEDNIPLSEKKRRWKVLNAVILKKRKGNASVPL